VRHSRVDPPAELSTSKPGGAAPRGDIIDLRDLGTGHSRGLEIGCDTGDQSADQDLLQVRYDHWLAIGRALGPLTKR
jgi:hypothetical protein